MSVGSICFMTLPSPTPRDSVSLCKRPGFPGTCSIDQTGLEFTEIRLPLAAECWDLYTVNIEIRPYKYIVRANRPLNFNHVWKCGCMIVQYLLRDWLLYEQKEQQWMGLIGLREGRKKYRKDQKEKINEQETKETRAKMRQLQLKVGSEK